MRQKLHMGVIPWMVVVVAVLAGWSASCRAAGLFTFDDMEKPKPDFTRNNGEIAAKLIPRAKSTSVVIRFAVTAGGRLTEVRGVDFASVDRPEVDVKNFKSAAFEMRIVEVPQAGEVKVAIRSDFFTSSTAFYVFNPKLAKPWVIPKVLNASLPDRARELQLTIADGGELDADGAADGQITLIGGPRDSFWGYALGTLFIRFFGIFIVLSFLMVGMLISGFVFIRLERRKLQETGKVELTGAEQRSVPDVKTISAALFEGATDEEVAAVGVALHLHFNRVRALAASDGHVVSMPALWAATGRQRIMDDRLGVFNRWNRLDN